MGERLLQVFSGWACFGLVVRDGLVVDAPPIARHLAGRPEAWVWDACRGNVSVVSDSDWCEYGQLPVSMCAHCTAARPAMDFTFAETYAIAEAAADRPRRIEALYDGLCRRCGCRWEPGVMIEYDEDESAWCHAQC
jgi:hypothetical protein